MLAVIFTTIVIATTIWNLGSAIADLLICDDE